MALRNYFGTNHDHRLWFVLCLFVAAVLLPTACVLWLINDSISQQRQIARQQLIDVYRSQLKLVSQRLDDYWRTEATKLSEITKEGPSPKAWANAVRGKLVDSLILYNAQGHVIYPAPLLSAGDETPGGDWLKARQLEERPTSESAVAAAAAYKEIELKSNDPQTIARAVQAQARSLRQAGDKTAAASVIFERFLRPGLENALDTQGRVIAGDVLLMAIQIAPATDPRRIRGAARLRDLLNNYDSNPMRSAQRVFLMKELRSQPLPGEIKSFPTLDAEELALRLVEASIGRAFDGVVRPSGIKDVWIIGSNIGLNGGQAAGVLRTESVKQRVQSFLAAQSLPKSVRLMMVEHGANASGAIDAIPVGAYLPDARIALLPTDQQPFEQLASRQMGLYVWTGALILAAVLVIALIAGRTIHRQMRLANLKSDLVATVSHELKTPLASTRLLLDTLLQADELEPVRTREYLELMERENTRLTQVIENFLAFSRLERSRYNFRFDDVTAADVVDRAMDAFAERAAEPAVQMSVEVAPDLPPIHADPGALSTVLVNLLDNAYKYTPDHKRIDLRAFQSNGSVCFEVQDNGIGVPKSEAAKVFRDFYQVDSRLARAQGGCGLGLSIVKFIVQAHKGTVTLDSRVGEGATFRVAVPHSNS